MPKYLVKKTTRVEEYVVVEASNFLNATERVRKAQPWERFLSDPNSPGTKRVTDVECVREVVTLAPQFDEEDLFDMGTEYNGKTRFYFSGAMVSACVPLLNDCDDNYDVRDLLLREKVIRKGTEEDTESCDINLGFKTKKTALSFITRFNTFLRKRYDQVQSGKSFSRHTA